MEKTTVSTEHAPRAIGPYSQAVRCGPWLFLSGQIGLDPRTGELVGPEVAAQARQALCNLQAVLQAAGMEMADVVRTTVYLTRMEDFATVNEVYGSFFTPPYPARATVGVASLPRGALVEIEACAYRASDG